MGYFEDFLCSNEWKADQFLYSFREGETAWIYARNAKCLPSSAGRDGFLARPYQIGHENEEGIESGAFWFYRKLGFRPTQSRIEKLTENEEQKIADRDSYRTAARTLRRLAAGTMTWEFDKARRGDWDQFQVRNIGFKVQRQMAAQFKGDPEKMRQDSLELVSRALEFSLKGWSEAQREALA